ncbi:hypothetical protein FHV99_002607 [Ochrobactrum sp. P20RRXII]|nr:hypothetical protein [Ochrobactrum sp. P20RRXII]
MLKMVFLCLKSLSFEPEFYTIAIEIPPKKSTVEIISPNLGDSQFSARDFYVAN